MEYTKGEQKIDEILKEIDATTELLPKLRAKIETLQAQNADMYEALKGMLNIFNRDLSVGTIGYVICAEASQALAKAEGKG